MTETITLDTSKCESTVGNARIAPLRRGERGNVPLVVFVRRNLRPYDLTDMTAHLVWKAADGKLVGPVPMEVTDPATGTVRCTLPDACYSTVGTARAYVELRRGAELVDTTDELGVKVLDCIDADAEQAEEYKPLIAEVRDAVASAKRAAEGADAAKDAANKAAEAAIDSAASANNAADEARAAVSAYTEIIKQNKKRITSLEGTVSKQGKQIANLQGIAATEETDSTEAYTKTVPTGAQKWASLDKVGGKTVVWNQHCDEIRWTGGNGAKYDGYAELEATSSSNRFMLRYDSITYPILQSGHVYINSAQFMVPGGSGFVTEAYYAFGNSTKTLSRKNATSANSWDEASSIVKVNETGQGLFQFALNEATFPASYRIKDGSAFVIDLTQMFGAGNEPTDISDPRIDMIRRIAEERPEYNPGELMSAEVVEVESRGKNLLDLSGNDVIDRTVNGIRFVYDPANNTMSAKGTATGKANLWWIMKDVYKQDNLGDLYIHTHMTTNPTNTSLALLAGDMNSQIGYFTPNTYNAIKKISTINEYNAEYAKKGIGGMQLYIVSGTTVDYTIQLSIEATNADTPYAPPFSTSFTIPDEVRDLCPGYGWSAGTACNEIDFGRKVYVQRVGSVDLGTLDWNADARYDNVQFYSGSIADKTIANGGCICAKYSWVKNQAWSSNVNKTIGFVGGAHQVLIVDNDYQDAGAFKVAMHGVILYYELAEPIEVDLSDVLTDDNFIEVEAGGTVTFKQASTQLPVPSSVTYQISTSEVIANA